MSPIDPDHFSTLLDFSRWVRNIAPMNRCSTTWSLGDSSFSMMSARIVPPPFPAESVSIVAVEDRALHPDKADTQTVPKSNVLPNQIVMANPLMKVGTHCPRLIPLAGNSNSLTGMYRTLDIGSVNKKFSDLME